MVAKKAKDGLTIHISLKQPVNVIEQSEVKHWEIKWKGSPCVDISKTDCKTSLLFMSCYSETQEKNNIFKKMKNTVGHLQHLKGTQVRCSP